jgi:hypothetical protein
MVLWVSTAQALTAKVKMTATKATRKNCERLIFIRVSILILKSSSLLLVPTN